MCLLAACLIAVVALYPLVGVAVLYVTRQI